MFKSYVEIKRNNDNLFPIMPSTIGIYHNQGEMQRPNGFDFHQFLWISKGECEVEIPGEKHILKEGQCFFSKKNAPHSYKSTGGELLTGWVSFSGGEDILKAFGIDDYLFFDMPDFSIQSAKQLLEICHSAGMVALRAAHTNLWITEVLCGVQISNQSLSEQVYTILERDFDKNITLASIAESMHYNKYSLCHAYMKEKGESIMQTLKKIRIRKAKHMLKYSDYPIEDVGKYCGFESCSYFIKIFKTETGKTPGQYKKKL